MPQTDLYLTISVPQPGLLVIQYHSHITDRSHDLTFDVITDAQSAEEFYLAMCPFLVIIDNQ